MIPIAGWVAPFGYPRIKACSRLPMAFRSVPRPSSPPDAKASTERPYLARNHDPRSRETPATHHAQEPSTPSSSHPKVSMRSRHPAGQTLEPTIVNASEHNAAVVGCHRPQARNRAGQTPTTRPQPNTPIDGVPAKTPTTRPETHQNLIDTDKDHDAAPPKAAARTERHTTPPDPTRPGPDARCRTAILLRDDAAKPKPGQQRERDDQPNTPTPGAVAPGVVEVDGIEPTTPCLQSRCSAN